MKREREKEEIVREVRRREGRGGGREKDEWKEGIMKASEILGHSL